MNETLTLRVPSETDPRLTYLMHVQGDEITCSCIGFNTHGHCKHQDGLRVVLNEGKDKMPEDTTAVATRDNVPPPAIVVGTPGTALLPSRDEMQLMTDIAKTVFAAGGSMIPKNITSPYQALAVMIAGHELGLRPMTSLRHVYIVNGKTEIETRAMVGIVKARDPNIKFEWPEYTSDAVTCIVGRAGQAPVTVRYTRADAEASGQMAKGGPWKQYTRDMLYAAATKRAVRLACPDIINAIDSGLQHTVIEAEAQDVTPARFDVRAAMEAAPANGGIPADAYNEGDEPEAPPEPPQQPPTVRLQRWLRAMKARKEPGLSSIIKGINLRYTGAINANGDLMLSGTTALSEDQAQDILYKAGIEDAPAADSDDTPADADAPDDGEQTRFE